MSQNTESSMSKKPQEKTTSNKECKKKRRKRDPLRDKLRIEANKRRNLATQKRRQAAKLQKTTLWAARNGVSYAKNLTCKDLRNAVRSRCSTG